MCKYLWPYFFFCCHNLHCPSKICWKSFLRALQGIAPENHSIGRGWSTTQRQTLYLPALRCLTTIDFFFSIYWVKNKYCTCSTVEINIYAFGFKNSFDLFSVGLFIPKSVIRSELDLKCPCSFSVVTVWQSESCVSRVIRCLPSG